MLIFGHRGAPGQPRFGENTIASFDKAVTAGADGLEFDVRRCRDGQIVVIHDETVNRTTNGRGLVRDQSYGELKKLNVENGGTIPLLSDVLDRFGGKCLLNIELKDAGIGKDVKQLVDERRLYSHVIVSSFDWRELEMLAGTLPIALLSSKSKNLIQTAVDLRATAIHPRKDIATPSLINNARNADLRIHVWTVNEPQEISFFRQAKVDGIFSDFPEQCTTSAS